MINKETIIEKRRQLINDERRTIQAPILWWTTNDQYNEHFVQQTTNDLCGELRTTNDDSGEWHKHRQKNMDILFIY